MGMAAVPLVIMAVGTAISAAGVAQQASAASADAKYKEKVAERNELLAQRKADDARERGKVEAREQQIRTAQATGSFRASAAGRGVQVDTGSAFDIQRDIEELGELDELTIRSNAEREALGFEAQAAEFQGEQSLQSSRAEAARTSGIIGTGSTLLGGAGSVASKWYAWQ